MKSDIFSQVNSVRTASEICTQIEHLILEGVLRVGDKFPGERELSERFGVSRPILREALKELELRELVHTRHGGGTYVADVIGDVFTKPMFELIASKPKATADYLEYRREVEAIAASFAARRRTDDDLALLTDTMNRMEAAHQKEDFRDETNIDVEFHQLIAEAAHNIILMHTLRACYRLLSDGAFFSRSLIYGFPGARRAVLTHHRAIYDAIVARDSEGAARAVTTHIDFVETCRREAEKAGGWENVSKLRRIMRDVD